MSILHAQWVFMIVFILLDQFVELRQLDVLEVDHVHHMFAVLAREKHLIIGENRESVLPLHNGFAQSVTLT